MPQSTTQLTVIPSLSPAWKRVEEHYGAAFRFGRRAIEEAWHCGDALIAAKGETKHGEWLPALKAVGISHTTADRLIMLRSRFAEIAQLVQFESVSAALKPQGQQQARKARNAQAAAARAAREGRAHASAPIAWHVCDIHDLADRVEAESVDVIVTDPPYEVAALSVWRSLATFAGHALRPGGLLVALSGQIALQGVFRELEHGCADTSLVYRWTLCYNMPGATTRVWSPRMLCHWKPVLVYQRADGIAPHFLDDLITAPVRAEQDDAHHKWGQQEGGMAELVRRVAAPGDVLCDPFCGGGTIPLVAAQRGCEVIAADLDADCVTTARYRLAATGPHLSMGGPPVVAPGASSAAVQPVMALDTMRPAVCGLVAPTRRQRYDVVTFESDSTATAHAPPAVPLQDERPQPTPPPR